MSTLITITAGVAVVAAGLGHLLAAAPAQADAQQDQQFYWLLTRPDGANLTITSFPLVRAQGITACQRQDAGEPPYQTLKDLQYPSGPYTFDIANSITSAAEAIYCPWHIGSLQEVTGSLLRLRSARDPRTPQSRGTRPGTSRHLSAPPGPLIRDSRLWHII